MNDQARKLFEPLQKERDRLEALIASWERRLAGRESEPIYIHLAHARKEWLAGNFDTVRRDLERLYVKDLEDFKAATQQACIREAIELADAGANAGPGIIDGIKQLRRQRDHWRTAAEELQKRVAWLDSHNATLAELQDMPATAGMIAIERERAERAEAALAILLEHCNKAAAWYMFVRRFGEAEVLHEACASAEAVLRQAGRLK